MEPRIPRKNVRRLSAISDESKEIMVKLLKAAKLTGGYVSTKDMALSAEVTPNESRRYMQWLKRYGWATNLGKGLGWTWIPDVEWNEVIGASSIKEYRFRFDTYV